MARLSKKYRDQGMKNESYDEDYGIIKIAGYGWDSSGSQYVAIGVTSTGFLKVTAS